MSTPKSKLPRNLAAAAILLVALSVAYVQVMARSSAILDSRHASPPAAVAAATSPEAIAEGRRLVLVTACAGCHGADLTGGPLNVFGTSFHTPNLTIAAKRLSDAELERALRRGVRPDGTSELVMPAQAYARFTDGELADIIGYLRSLPDKGVASPKPAPGVFLRAALLAGALRTSVDQVAAARLPLDAGPAVEAGRHLTAIACARCHGADLSGINNAGTDLTVRGYYSRPKFHALLAKGEAIGEGNMRLMTDTAEASFSHLTPAEIDEIYDYLDARDGVLVARAKAK